MIILNSQYKQMQFEDYVENVSKGKFIDHIIFPLLKKFTTGTTVSQIIELLALDIISEAYPLKEIGFFEH